jgi:hypothetical protein
LKIIASILLAGFFFSINAFADSTIYITRPGHSGGTQGTELVCLGSAPQTPVCTISRTRNLKAVKSKEIPASDADLLFQEFGTDVGPEKPGKSMARARNGITWSLEYNGNRRTGHVSGTVTANNQEQLAVLKLETKLNQRLQ